MAYAITSQCIECGRCQSHCPTGAVLKLGERYQIDSTLCNNCINVYNVPQCWAVCPTNSGCIPGPETTNFRQASFPIAPPDYWDSWFDTYNRLIARLRTAKQSDYWQRWFDIYATQLSNLQAHQC